VVLMLSSEAYSMIYALLSLYLCVCMCPHIIEMKRVYDVYQYIFSREESSVGHVGITWV
jgi:hypothetical protein